MPELPEVEAARSAIAEHCLGKKIIKAIIDDDPKVINGVSRTHFEESILNKTIVAAHRKGKNMWLQLDSPPFPSFQFGMAGAIYIKGVAVTKYKRSAVNDSDEWPSKYSKFFIELNDGLEISFTDKRRFATVRLLDDPASLPPISALGPDALLEPMTEEEFFNSLNKKKTTIKSLLLDQGFISGIGNWVADEVLYQARIHPSQNASSLSKDESARLLKCIKEVLEKAVEVEADSSQYPSSWILHSREKKPGKAFVDGKKIEFITVGGRTSAYVPELQKLSGVKATKASPKLQKQASKKKKDDHSDDDGGDDGNDDNGDGSEEKMENVKSKDTKNSRSGKPQTRRKNPTKNGDEIDDDDDETTKRSKTPGGRATAKRKSQGMEDRFDPSIERPVKKLLKVKLYMGYGWHLDFKRTHFDPFSPPDFFTQVEIFGLPADTKKEKTSSIQNQWVPMWNHEFEFRLTAPEIALLRLKVNEHDVDRRHGFAGQTCLPVSELRSGIRAVPLYNKKGEKYNNVKLLVQFQILPEVTQCSRFPAMEAM